MFKLVCSPAQIGLYAESVQNGDLEVSGPEAIALAPGLAKCLAAAQQPSRFKRKYLRLGKDRSSDSMKVHVVYKDEVEQESTAAVALNAK